MRYILLLALAATSLVTHSVLAFEYKLSFTQQQIQQQLATRLPIERDFGLMQMSLNELAVDLLDDPRPVKLKAKLNITSFQYTGVARVSVSGDIRYDARDGSFYMDHVLVQNIQVEQVPESFLPVIKDVAQQVLTQALAQQPIYTLSDASMEESLLKANLQSVYVEGKSLYIVLDMK